MYMAMLKNLKIENLQLHAKCLRALAFCRLQVKPQEEHLGGEIGNGGKSKLPLKGF